LRGLFEKCIVNIYAVLLVVIEDYSIRELFRGLPREDFFRGLLDKKKYKNCAKSDKEDQKCSSFVEENFKLTRKNFNF
jgi:hypothetical protein